MSRVVVVGSGASGVHFALTALELGHTVTMLDAGGARPQPIAPDAAFSDLKERLPDPVAHFLGDDFSGVVYPGSRSSFYGFPPSKDYVFATPSRFSYRTGEMKPWFTFARGGFAETWTAGVYPFNDEDLSSFPFDYAALRTGYRNVAERIGIGAERDDLERFLSYDCTYLDPLPLDPHSAWLLASYRRRRSALHRMGWYLGRSRVATLSRDQGDRKACAQLGRCLWGCPTESIYTPAATLRQCLSHPRFRYVPGVFVTHFDYGEDGRISAIHADRLEDSTSLTFDADEYALAAGALLSSKIYLDSVFRQTGRVLRLEGLMDNRQIHVPFLTLQMIGRGVETASYQFHHLAFGLEGQEPGEDYVHGQITTLKSAAVHPIVQSLPLDMKSALQIFRSMRAGLAVANVNLSDSRRASSYVSIEPVQGGDTRLVLNYESAADEPARITRSVRRVRKAIGRMGGLVPPGMTRILPKGTSVHYAGTLPMSSTLAPMTCTQDCRSHDFRNLLFVDAVSFPALPAKNHTFTLMANATRIAHAALGRA